jgi:3-methyladenine DNA glycosylase/8-oxoguanine DNA glycosylase
MNAKLRAEFEIPATPPFHFVGTVSKPSHFPSSDVAFDGTTYRQSMRLGAALVGIRMRAAGSEAAPTVAVTVYATRKLSVRFVRSLAEELARRFDLNAELSDFERVCQKDRALRPVWQRWKGMRASAGLSLYEFLAIATVLQNATVRRSVQMLEAMFGRFGSKLSFDGQTLSAFWPPEAVDAADEQELRDLKLGYRAKVIKRQTRAFVAGALDEQTLRTLPSPDLRSQLLAAYGIGPASVGYLMFEVFKRYDSFVHVSPWEQKIFSRLLFDEELVDAARVLAEVDHRWGRWKSLASHYLFEDLFWRRRTESIPWLEALIRL